jgi:hypothetical protein
LRILVAGREKKMASPERGAYLSALLKVLIFAAMVEIGTGLILEGDPGIVVKMLLGDSVSGAGTQVVARLFGIALLALGIACWPSTRRHDIGAAAFRAMLAYNALLALSLAYTGAVEHLAGLLLWPAVGLHAMVALWLLWAWHPARPND